MPEDFSQLTAIGIITLFLIKEMFAFLKARKGNNGISMDFKLINHKLDNELTHITGKISIIKEDIRELKEDIREIKVDILNIKIGKNKS